jgi:hypothetical protein
MLRKIIKPIQYWLLNNGQCVGCGRPLSLGKKVTKNNKTITICKCGRIFVKENDKFRRALFEEI